MGNLAEVLCGARMSASDPGPSFFSVKHQARRQHTLMLRLDLGASFPPPKFINTAECEFEACVLRLFTSQTDKPRSWGCHCFLHSWTRRDRFDPESNPASYITQTRAFHPVVLAVNAIIIQHESV